MTDEIEGLIERHADDLGEEGARQVRAFHDLLGRIDPPSPPGGPTRVQAVTHWDYDYMMGGPTPPLRWEGDDS